MGSDSDTRNRGFLTSSDREYLRGEKEYDHRTSEMHRRQDIRTRFKNALLDISLILEQLGDEDLRKSVEETRVSIDKNSPPSGISGETYIGRARASPGEAVAVMDRDAERGLYDMLILLYRTMLVLGRNGTEDEMQFSRLLEAAHEDAVGRYKPELVVREIEHAIDTWNRDSLASFAERKYNAGERLTGWQTQALLETGRIPDEEVGKYLRERTDGVDG